MIAQANGKQQPAQSQSNSVGTRNSSRCEFWSDYLLPTLHSKSLHLLEGVHAFSTPFTSFARGHDAVCELEAMEERIRGFVEACDWLQGFQVMAASHDAFCGLLPPLMQAVRDAYANKCVLLYDAKPTQHTMLSGIQSSHGVPYFCGATSPGQRQLLA